MDFSIECPICEEKFSVSNGPPDQEIKCPCCSRSFALSAAVPLATPIKKTPSAQPIALSPSTRLPTPQLKRPGRPPQDANDQDSDSDIGPTVPPSLSDIRKQNHRRKSKRKAIVALATAGFLLAVIGTLSFLLYRQVNRLPQATRSNEPTIPLPTPTGSPQGNTPPESNPRSQSIPPATKDSRQTPPRQDAPAPVPPQPLRLADLPPQEFSYLKPQQAEECWKLVQPHLVSLKVFDGQGTHPASATMIDSRGWIVTSYNAVAGASKIEVTASAKSIDDLPDPNLLTDQVRGVIAVDPKNDIAILSINRRFVVSFAEIKIDETNGLVAGQHLLQSAPPSATNPYGRTESNITARRSFDDFDAAEQAIAKRHHLANPDLTWLVAQHQDPPLPGSAFVLSDGTLSAINVFTLDGHAYYVSVAGLKDFIRAANDNLQPLSILAGTEGTPRMTAVDSNHPMRKVSVRLNQLGAACEEFGWAPQTETEFSDLQAFADYTTQALRFSIENKNNRIEKDQVKKIEDQVKRWEKSLSQHLGAIHGDDTQPLKKLNELAELELAKPNRIVPFFGKVLYAGFEIPEHVLLELDDRAVVVNIPHNPEGAPMLPDSQWLFVVKTPARKKLIKFNLTGKTITTQSVGLLFSIGPMD